MSSVFSLPWIAHGHGQSMPPMSSPPHSSMWKNIEIDLFERYLCSLALPEAMIQKGRPALKCGTLQTESFTHSKTRRIGNPKYISFTMDLRRIKLRDGTSWRLLFNAIKGRGSLWHRWLHKCPESRPWTQKDLRKFQRHRWSPHWHHPSPAIQQIVARMLMPKIQTKTSTPKFGKQDFNVQSVYATHATLPVDPLASPTVSK